MADSLDIERVVEAAKEILPLFGKKALKNEQEQILNALMHKKDCIAVLPTGYGKSLPYQLHIHVARKLGLPRQRVVVCCPLISLMQDQVQFLTTIPDLSAAYKGSSANDDKKIEDGLVDIIYASPETLVGDPKWRNIIQNLNVSVLVIDEFHTIATWGEDGDGIEKKAFRKWFSYIGELRSLFPEASVLALSATCTVQIRKRVMKIMNLKPDTLEITKSPNKPNIKLVASKVSTTLEMAMSWLVDGLVENLKSFPRTILYCTSISDASNLYEYLKIEIPECKKHFEMYHSETPVETKDNIIKGLKNSESELKLVLATNALGMGVDLVNFHSVICFGIPENVLDLVQEIGRIGRDGQSSIALLLFHSYHLTSASTEVKDIFKTTECRRIMLMKKFLRPHDLDELKKETGNHSCCDNCAILCSCGDCSTLPMENIFTSTGVLRGDAESESDSEKTEEYDPSDYESDDMGLE